MHLSQSCLVQGLGPQGNALLENAQKKCENCRKVSIHLNCKFPVSIAIGKCFSFLSFFLPFIFCACFFHEKLLDSDRLWLDNHKHFYERVPRGHKSKCHRSVFWHMRNLRNTRTEWNRIATNEMNAANE